MNNLSFGAISAEEAWNIRHVEAWQAFSANTRIRTAIQQNKRHVSFRVYPKSYQSDYKYYPSLERLLPSFIEFAKELNYEVRVVQNKLSKRVTIRWR